jgi:hypothetical protein
VSTAKSPNPAVLQSDIHDGLAAKLSPFLGHDLDTIQD